MRTASSWTPASARPRPAYRNAGDFETQARALGGWRRRLHQRSTRRSGHRGRRDELRDDVRGWDPRRGAAPFRPTRGALLRRHPTPATVDSDRYDNVHRAIALSFTECAGTTDVKVCDRHSGAILVGREPAGLTWRGAARPRTVAAPRRRASPSHGADRRGQAAWVLAGARPRALRPRARRGRSAPPSHAKALKVLHRLMPWTSVSSSPRSSAERAEPTVDIATRSMAREFRSMVENFSTEVNARTRRRSSTSAARSTWRPRDGCETSSNPTWVPSRRSSWTSRRSSSWTRRACTCSSKRVVDSPRTADH